MRYGMLSLVSLLGLTLMGYAAEPPPLRQPSVQRVEDGGELDEALEGYRARMTANNVRGAPVLLRERVARMRRADLAQRDRKASSPDSKRPVAARATEDFEWRNLGLSYLPQSAVAKSDRIDERPIFAASFPSFGLQEEPASQPTSQPEKTAAPPSDDGELSRQMSNPVSNLWMLFLQYDITIMDVDGFDDKRVLHNFKFQPVMPITLTEEWRLITRPVFQFNSFDIPQRDREFDNDIGMGDTVLLTAFSNSDPAGEWVYGVGPTWIFPTATEPSLGARKWAVGPAAMVFYLGEKWIAGVVWQNWFSFGGAGDESLSLMDLQYVVRYRVTPTINLGFGPNIQYDWEENDWSVPVGFGGDVLVKISKVPVRFGAEAYYYVDRFKGVDEQVGVRFFMIPVIPAPGWATKPLFGN